MITSFRCKDTEELANRARNKRWANIAGVALRKLRLLDAATSLDDLRVPPGNRLKELDHDRAGQHSIRINDQWRICFVWNAGNADSVEIVDYH